MLKEEIFSQEQAWVRVRDPRWYRALSLTERLESRQAVSAPQTGEEAAQCELASMRMEQWNSQLAFTRGVDFAERLAADNLTEDDLLALLSESAEAIQRHTPVMSWMERLKSLFEDTDVPDEAEWLTRLSTQKLSLLNSVDLFLQDGLQRLGEAVSALVREYEQIPFHEERVVTLFLPALARPLIIAMNRTLVLELNVARLEDRLQGETPEERFQDFVRRVREKTGLLAILEEYPLLARQLLNIVDRWLNYTLEFLQHLCADWQDLRAIFSPESDPGLLTAVEGGAGDTHRGGRSVLKVKFSSGLQLVYKPKSLAIDVHFQELLQWLNERGYQPAFRVVRLLNRETYGWSEFVDSHGCESPEEVTRFYERQGGYLALLYALSATDFHFENLIAAGEHPVLIDLEALFHPYFAEEETNSSDSAFDAMRYSVMRIGLLPSRIYANSLSRGLDISGLGGHGGQKTPRPVAQWEQTGTDQMRLIRQHGTMDGRNNRPTLAGEDVDLLDYSPALVTGFTSMYRLLVEQRDAFLAGPLSSFAQDEIRYIIRPTSFYANLLTEGTHPDLLHDGLDLDCHLDHLWLMTAQAPHIARLLPFERADLLNGDIPMFTTRPDSRAIYASRGETIDDFLAQPSLEMTRQLILQFDENDLKRQLWFIEASFATTLMEREQPAWKRPTVFASTGRAATPERLLAAARAIGDHLCDLAIHDRRGASWVGLALLQERQWMLNVVPPDLYNGSLGITLFLSYLGAITGETRYTEIAQAAYVTLDQQLEQMKDRFLTVGAFDGWGAMIYLLAHLGVLWHDPTCFSDAEDIVRLLPDLIAKDQMFDVISGSAGCILSLASLYHVSPSPALLETMKLCGERLKETAQAGSGGKAWQGPIPASAPLTGFSHGAAGCMLALLTLAELSGDERFRQPALGALDYERSVFSPPAQNWPDFRVLKDPDEQDPPELADAGYAVTWCHGAPGIGLSRLAALRYLDNEQIREEIRVALNTTIKQGFGLNHSLCHGDLGNLETLLLANQLLPDARYSEHLKHFSGLILDSIEVDGWLTGIPLGVESPGLMTGLAGIGYELLRLAVPERVPSVLLLAPPPLNHT